MPGLTALALVVAASATAPAVSHAPPYSAPGDHTHAWTPPACPDWFTVKTSTATQFVCAIAVPDQSWPQYLSIAHATPCAPAAYWNVGPLVHTSTVSRTTVVTWTCKHR